MLIVIANNYYYIRHELKQENHINNDIDNIKMTKNNELKEIDTKKSTCYYFNVIINITGLDFNNKTFEGKSSENVYLAESIYLHTV